MGSPKWLSVLGDMAVSIKFAGVGAQWTVYVLEPDEIVPYRYSTEYYK